MSLHGYFAVARLLEGVWVDPMREGVPDHVEEDMLLWDHGGGFSLKASGCVAVFQVVFDSR